MRLTADSAEGASVPVVAAKTSPHTGMSGVPCTRVVWRPTMLPATLS